MADPVISISVSIAGQRFDISPTTAGYVVQCLKEGHAMLDADLAFADRYAFHCLVGAFDAAHKQASQRR